MFDLTYNFWPLLEGPTKLEHKPVKRIESVADSQFLEKSSQT